MLDLELAKSRSLMICTPIGRAPSWQYTVSLLKTIRTLDSLGIKSDAVFVVGNSNLPKARNELAARFLASGYSHCLLVDDDTDWSAGNVVRLLASPHDFVGGVVRKRCDKPNEDPDVWCARWLNKDLLTQDRNGAIMVAGVGTAFMRLSRQVFQTMIERHPDWKRRGRREWEPDVKANYYRFFQFADDGQEEQGEDFAFCDQWRALGGEVWIDPDLSFGHVGERTYRGQVSEVFVRKSLLEFQQQNDLADSPDIAVGFREDDIFEVDPIEPAPMTIQRSAA